MTLQKPAIYVLDEVPFLSGTRSWSSTGGFETNTDAREIRALYGNGMFPIEKSFIASTESLLSLE